MIQKLKHNSQKALGAMAKFFKDQVSYFILIVSLAALGFSAYNTYVLATAEPPTGRSGLDANAKKVTPEAVAQMIANGAPVLGNPKAEVTIVEFADFQCPFCYRYSTEILPQIKQRYIDTYGAKFVFMNFAFLGQESKDSAEAAKCAQDQGKFWEYHDYLYKNQQGENRGNFNADNLKRYAKELKLNTSDFNECLDSNRHEKAVSEETALGRSFGVKGTPATFINDFFISGAQGTSYFLDKIQEFLDK